MVPGGRDWEFEVGWELGGQVFQGAREAQSDRLLVSLDEQRLRDVMDVVRIE
jgi:hypothetical protein